MRALKQLVSYLRPGARASRFDLPDAKKRCPVIQVEKNLEKEFDEFFSVPDVHAVKPKTAKQEHGGETANGEK